MTAHKDDADSTQAKSEGQELREKGREERGIDERSGHADDGSSNHPETKRTGYKSDSNAGEDLTSGDG
ncbi:MAG: hypothetical protein JWN04_6293 [Myxococcaceae bacterium]|nr:hypothetical protein [Myxococcaceae bacterium]